MDQKSYLSSDDIRERFSAAISDMYRQEVPLYGELLDIVAKANAEALAASHMLEDELRAGGELTRINMERHGAIRLGSPAELAIMRRVFAVMGMYPVGYYDLTLAGVPVHATAFRPIEPAALQRNPFRVFTSLLRLDLIENKALRDTAATQLAKRRIFSDKALRLTEKFEAAGGLGTVDATHFVSEALETFRWHAEAAVDGDTYRALSGAHQLIADVVAFKGPHINHLTPRTLDIDAAQREMERRGIGAKAVIEGPPRRRHPILLRQTSFTAVAQTVRFVGAQVTEVGTHTARFGEIEQRGIALTQKGRVLYDKLLAQALHTDDTTEVAYPARLTDAFRKFPDDLAQIRREGLAYFRYGFVESAVIPEDDAFDLETEIGRGTVRADPIVYEDFLPVSAAGIFRSNLGLDDKKIYGSSAAEAEFVEALGSETIDPFRLYAKAERESVEALRAIVRRNRM